MSVVLDAIKFNHDPNSATADALNIRKYATEFVTVPEWQQGLSLNPEDSPTAYSIAGTQGHVITIQAKFHRTDPSLQSIEVRALDAHGNPPGHGGCLGWLIRLLWFIFRALFGNVLGEVKAKTVTFLPNGQTNFETFELHHVRLWSAVNSPQLRSDGGGQQRVGLGSKTRFTGTAHACRRCTTRRTRAYSARHPLDSRPFTHAAAERDRSTMASRRACRPCCPYRIARLMNVSSSHTVGTHPPMSRIAMDRR